MNLTTTIKNDNIITRRGGIIMAFSDAEKFNRIMEEIESLVNWYENTHLSEKATKVFLSNGASFVYKVPKRQIAHLLTPALCTWPGCRECRRAQGGRTLRR